MIRFTFLRRLKARFRPSRPVNAPDTVVALDLGHVRAAWTAFADKVDVLRAEVGDGKISVNDARRAVNLPAIEGPVYSSLAITGPISSLKSEPQTDASDAAKAEWHREADAWYAQAQAWFVESQAWSDKAETFSREAEAWSRRAKARHESDAEHYAEIIRLADELYRLAGVKEQVSTLPTGGSN